LPLGIETANYSFMGELSIKRTVFFTGAGISMAFPSNCPSGNELISRVARYAYRDNLEVIDKVKRLHLPVLETLLECIHQGAGVKYVADCLSDIKRGKPNHYHQFFANHLALGGRHITMNFDKMIERSLNGDTESLLHLHGTIPIIVENKLAVGATYGNIRHGGFDERITHSILELLSKSNTTLVFMGYSGGDVFDVTPFFGKHFNRISRTVKRIVWINHNSSVSYFDAKMQKDEFDNDSTLIKLLADSQIEFDYISCNTEDIVVKLSDRWFPNQIIPTGKMRRPKWHPEQRINKDCKYEIYQKLQYLLQEEEERSVAFHQHREIWNEEWEQFCVKLIHNGIRPLAVAVIPGHYYRDELEEPPF
jgi:hypothetical protein